MAEEMLKALGEAPDGELVRVEEREQKVRIAKVGANLEIKVSQLGSREDVSVTVPLSMARTLLREARRGSLGAPAVVSALREARLTTLVDVRSGDEHVRVTVW
jgi:CYTH domain-containing protein